MEQHTTTMLLAQRTDGAQCAVSLLIYMVGQGNLAEVPIYFISYKINFLKLSVLFEIELRYITDMKPSREIAVLT